MHTHAREARARARKFRHAGTSMYLLNEHTSNKNFLSRSARSLRGH